MEQVIMILQSALMLLATLTGLGTQIPDNVRTQATDIASRALIYANQEMARLEKLPINATTTMPENNPSGNVPAEESVVPVSHASIELIYPILSKGLGRNFSTSPDTDLNQLHVGAIVRDENGEITRTAEVVVTATDETQNQTIKGSGDITKIKNKIGKSERVYYYPFNYEFRTAGKHTITFTANGVSKSVEVEVAAPQE